MTSKTLDRSFDLVRKEVGVRGARAGFVRVLVDDDGFKRVIVKRLLDDERHLSPLALLGLHKSLHTYWIAEDSTRELLFSRVHMHRSQIEGRRFHLDFRVSFRVSDAETLITHLDRDPLKRIEEHIGEVMATPIEALAWENLIDDATDVLAIAHAARRKTPDGRTLEALEYLQLYASGFGVSIDEIGLTRRLGDEAMQLINAEERQRRELAEYSSKADFELARKRRDEANALEAHKAEQARLEYERKLARLELEHQHTLDALKDERSTARQMSEFRTEFSKNAMEKMLEGTHTPGDLARLMGAMSGSLGGPSKAPGNGGRADAEIDLPRLSQIESNDPETLVGQGSLTALVERIVDMADSLDDEPGAELLGHALHLT